MTQAPAPGLPEAQQGFTEVISASLSPGAVPIARVSAGVTQAQQQALAEYENVVCEWQVRRQTRQGWLPQDRTSIMVQAAQRLEYARQRLVALGINPEGIRGG